MTNWQSRTTDLFALAKLAPGSPPKHSKAKPMTKFPYFSVEQIQSFFDQGYVAYLKMKGVHARVYPRNGTGPLILSQGGKDCSDRIDAELAAEIRRLFPEGDLEIEGFLSVESGILYVFDAIRRPSIKVDGTFIERQGRLPRVHGSKRIVVLEVHETMQGAMEAVVDSLACPDVEGLVFRKPEGKNPRMDFRAMMPAPRQ